MDEKRIEELEAEVPARGRCVSYAGRSESWRQSFKQHMRSVQDMPGE
jgi:hypothetical protein